MKKINGVALVQVLIISLCLSLFAVFVSQSVRSQVKTTEVIKVSNALHSKLKSVEARLFFALLTQPLYVQKNHENNKLASIWNFHGKEFELEESVFITLQDINALLHYNLLDRTLASRFFEAAGVKDDESRIFIDSIHDWVDKDDLSRLNGAEQPYYENLNLQVPRNFALQSVSEVKKVRGSHVVFDNGLERYFSLQRGTGFNPMNSPELILKAYIQNDSISEQIIKLREEGELNHINFSNITGRESDEYIKFVTGNTIAVTLRLTKRNVQLKKQFILTVKPQDVNRPLSISKVSWNS